MYLILISFFREESPKRRKDNRKLIHCSCIMRTLKKYTRLYSKILKLMKNYGKTILNY